MAEQRNWSVYKMLIQFRVIKVKQYNSTYKYIVLHNSAPVCITQSHKRASTIVAYLQGHEVTIGDRKIKKKLDQIRKEIQNDRE